MNTNSYNQECVAAYDETFSLDDEKASRLEELFCSFSDPNRLRILSVLPRGETHVQQISEIVFMSHSAVSHQLRGLRQLRIVRVRKQGRLAIYCLDETHIAGLFQRGLDHVCHE